MKFTLITFALITSCLLIATACDEDHLDEHADSSPDMQGDSGLDADLDIAPDRADLAPSLEDMMMAARDADVDLSPVQDMPPLEDMQPSMDMVDDADMSTPDPLVAQVTQGAVRGQYEQNQGVISFLGVPYAAPPVGDLRWAATQAHSGWSGELAASQFGYTCPQTPKLNGFKTQKQEDCLTLNVWRPTQVDAAERLPVLVYFHGGRFNWGGTSLEAYHGASMAESGVVTVTVNYRIGLLGFFSHAALPGRQGNFGFMDQVHALEWVQDHINAFGGDPTRVTIMGSSAGGSSVGHLVASPQVPERLFRAAVMLSGGGLGGINQPHVSDKSRAPNRLTGNERGDVMLGQLAAQDSVKAAHPCLADGQLDEMCQREVLRGVTTEQIMATGIVAANGSVPFVDDDLVPVPFMDAFEAGQQKPIPLLLGSVAWEASVGDGLIQEDPSQGTYLSPFDANRFMNDNCEDVLRWLHAPSIEDDRALAHRVWGDWRFLMPARRLADAHASRQPATYHYWFNYVGDFQQARKQDYAYGAPHPMMMPYLFQTLLTQPSLLSFYYGVERNETPSARDIEMSHMWHELVVDFIHGESQLSALNDSITWPEYQGAGDAQTLVSARNGDTSAFQDLFCRRHQFYLRHTFPQLNGCEALLQEQQFLDMVCN